MAKLIIIEDSMNIETVNENKSTKLDVNEIFDNIQKGNPIYTHLGLFQTVFNYCRQSNLGIKESCCFVLNSNLCLSKKIPISVVEYLSVNLEKYQINNLEIPSKKELEKIIRNNKNELVKIKTTYECKTNLDIITACLFHFVGRGHLLKTCPHCGKWFLTKSRNDQIYCERNSPLYPKMSCSRAVKYINQLNNGSEIKKLQKNVRQMISNKGEETKLFNNTCKKWKDKIKQGQTTEEEFSKHLKSYYKKKYKGGTE